MPFKSEAQRRYLFTKEPVIAKRWAKKYGTPKNLPMHKRTFKHGSPNIATGIHCLRSVGALK